MCIRDSITWYRAITRVEVIDEARDATIQGDGVTFRDTFGGSSSTREGTFRQGHVYKLYFGASSSQIVTLGQASESDEAQGTTGQQQTVLLGIAIEINQTLTPVNALKVGIGEEVPEPIPSTIERLFTGDKHVLGQGVICLLYTSPSPRDS